MIDYKLAKEIGATYHIDHPLYKFNDDGFAMCYFTEYGWEKTENDADHMAELAKIDFSNLKPRTRTEYEKVTESASHVIDELENGGEFYYMAPSLTKLALANRDGVFNKLRDGDALYRKVEKEIGERQEFIDAACELVDFDCVDFNVNIDCSMAMKSVIVAMAKSGKFKLVGSSGEIE